MVQINSEIGGTHTYRNQWSIIPEIGGPTSRNIQVEKKIRKMPDFVIEKEGKINFIEVKFRANGELDKSDFKGYPYPEAYAILVSLDNMKCIQIKQLLEGVKLNIKANSYLIEASEFYEKEYKSDFDNLILTLKKFYLVLNK